MNGGIFFYWFFKPKPYTSFNGYFFYLVGKQAHLLAWLDYLFFA